MGTDIRDQHFRDHAWAAVIAVITDVLVADSVPRISVIRAG